MICNDLQWVALFCGIVQKHDLIGNASIRADKELGQTVHTTELKN